MRFVSQTINDEIVHDFVWTLKQAQKYYTWKDDPFQIKYYEDAWDAHAACVPVGSVEFVCKYMALEGLPIPKPRNVPRELFPFACRQIDNMDLEGPMNNPWFIKSNDKIKAPPLFPAHLIKLPKGNYQVSEEIEFLTEWRGFVWRGNLVGLQNYAGDFTMMPAIDIVQDMITNFATAPCAYTLDVGVNASLETAIIEVHDFFSCGLYGFEDYQLLPLMLAGWYKEYVNKCKIQK